MTQKNPTLEQLVQYLSKNKHLLEKERNRYTVEGLMLMLDRQKLQNIERQFSNYPTGLELPIFLFIMKEIFNQNCIGDEKYELVDGLISLFQSIDINGDGHMVWEEFTGYIIETIKKEEHPLVANKNYMEKEIIESAYGKLGRQYKLSRVVELNLPACLQKLHYVEQLGSFISFYRNSNDIRLYNSAFQEKQLIFFDGSKPYFHIIDFAIDQQALMLGVLLPNKVSFMNLKTKLTARVTLECSGLDVDGVLNIWYLPLNRFWAFTTMSGEIRLYSVIMKARNVLEASLICSKKNHILPITCLRQLQQQDLICSCSLDGTVKLLSLHSHRQHQFEDTSDHAASVLDSKKKKGYLGFDYNGQFGRTILLYGFSNGVSIYCLDISLTRGYVGKYSEHTLSIKHAMFVKNNPFAVSMDDKCCIRVWNFKTFKTIQVIDGQKLVSSTFNMLVVPQLDSIFIAQRKVTIFKSLSFFKKSKQITQFHKIIDFHNNSYLNSFWVFTSNDARQYDSLTGRLKQVLTSLTDQKCEFIITAAEFGPKCRKIYIGDAAGFIREYSTQTGQFIQELKAIDDVNQHSPISKIVYVPQEDIVLCGSQDSRIIVFSRNDDNQYDTLRDIRGSHQSSLSGLIYSEAYKLMATSCQEGIINIWNSTRYILEAVLVTGSKGKLCSISFVVSYPVLIVCCETQILCYGVRPIEEERRYKCIFKIPCLANTCFDIETRRTLVSFLTVNGELNNLVRREQAHSFMAVGQANGKINIHCLDLAFRKHSIKQTEKVEIQEKSHHKRYDYCQVDKLVQCFLNRKPELGCHAPTLPLDVTLLTAWQAHSQLITAVNIAKQPFVIMTRCQDQKFRLWDLYGKQAGCINCSNFKTVFWNMPVCNIKQKLQQMDLVLYALKLIDDLVLSPYEQEQIKIRLLMNKYMNQSEKEAFRNTLKTKQKIIKTAQSSPVVDVASDVKISQIQFDKNYHELLTNIKERLMRLDEQFKSGQEEQVQCNFFTTNSGFELPKKTLVEHKEIRILRQKLDAIDSQVEEPVPVKTENVSKEVTKRPKKKKKYLFTTYTDLKRNLAAVHKMLRINSIR